MNQMNFFQVFLHTEEFLVYFSFEKVLGQLVVTYHIRKITWAAPFKSHPVSTRQMRRFTIGVLSPYGFKRIRRPTIPTRIWIKVELEFGFKADSDIGGS